MKKVLSMLLSVILVLSNLVIAPNASTVHAAEALRDEVKAGQMTSVYINPLYKEVVSADEISNVPSTLCASPSARHTYVTDESVVIDTIRQTMVERKQQVIVYYETKEQLGTDFLGEWIESAVDETGEPDEGDYLRWHYSEVQANSSYLSYPDGRNEYTIIIRFFYYTTAEQEKELSNEIDELLEELQISNALSDYQKVKKIYDYMCSNITYDYRNLNNERYELKFTAYAALIHKTAVCQGYANLLYRLLREVGIDTRIIAGIGNGGPHGWNIIKLDNLYYYADATWDAGQNEYQYFLKTGANFGDHISYEEYTTKEFQSAYPIAQTDYEPSDMGHKYVAGWQQDNVGWWYQNADGSYPVASWKQISGKWYYFNASGYMTTGWQRVGGTWYYLAGSGAMVSGWQAIGGVWYYFAGSGAMVTGWQRVGGTWYYLAGSGAMVTGWQAIGGTWYYFYASGAMVASQWVGNYYLQADGSMATNKWIGNYYVGSDGCWIP